MAAMTDIQADLTERVSAMYRRAYLRASDIWKHQQRDWEGIFVKCQREEMAAALQSEREAAAAEARRAVPPEAVAWCATLYRITEYLAKTPAWADEDIAHLRSIIALLDALASPTPQEEGN
jgi:hypothetical protein